MKPKVKIRNGIFGANDVSIKDVEYPNEPAIATKRLPNLFTKWGNMGPEKYLNTYEAFSKNDANIMLRENFTQVTYRVKIKFKVKVSIINCITIV